MEKEVKTGFITENIASVAVSLVCFLAYVTTLCPVVPFTDGGELAAVGVTLGIAHPTGYPLFTIFSRLAVMIPSAATQIVQLNVLAALFTAIAAGMFLKTIMVLLQTNGIGAKKGKGGEKVLLLAATVGSLALGFSSTFWSQSAEVEVYSLHLLLVMVIVYTFLRGIDETKTGEPSRFLFLFAFVLGLSFSNHMTTILLAPSFLYLFVRRFGFRRDAINLLLKLVPFFLLGLSLYIYLPIRSSVQPPFDWGHPATFERFIWHVTGKQYQVWMFSGWDVAKKQLSYYANNLPSEFHWLFLGVMVVGLWEAFRRSRRLFLFLLITFVATLTYSMNYDIHDIDSYFLLSYIVCGWLVAFGAYRLIEVGRKKVRLSILGTFFLIALALHGAQNMERVDQSNNYLVEDFVQNAFASLEPNAIVFTGLWDYFVSPAYYYQTVERMRPDVVVIDKSLLQNRSWYFMQMERNYSWLISQSRSKVDAFLVELHKFEREQPFDFAVIEQRWNVLLEDLVEQNLPTRPVYVDGRVEPEFSTKFKRTSTGLFFRLTKEDGHFTPLSNKFVFRQHNRKTPAIRDLRQYYVLMMIQESLWLRRENRVGEMAETLERASQIDPTNSTLVALRRQLASPASR